MAFWDPCETAITVRSSGSNCRSQRLVIGSRVGIPDGKIENSGKSIFEIRIPNFCYIQVIVFDLSYLTFIRHRLHRCWKRMLETKCVGDNHEMIANIHYLFTLAGTKIQKMLPASKITLGITLLFR